MQEFELLELNPPYSIYRYMDLKNQISVLMRSRRTVDMVYSLMDSIFVTSDVEQIQDPALQIDCISLKFKMAQMVAQMLRISLDDLL